MEVLNHLEGVVQLHVVRPLIASTDGQSVVTFPSDERSTSLSSKSFRSIAVLPSASLALNLTPTLYRRSVDGCDFEKCTLNTCHLLWYHGTACPCTT